MKRLQQLMNDVTEWGNVTFDNGNHTQKRCIPTSYHLQKESKELTEALENFFKNPTLENSIKVKTEFADNLILLSQTAKLFGYDAFDLIESSFEKLDICRLRKWGKPDENGVVEHVRTYDFNPGDLVCHGEKNGVVSRVSIYSVNVQFDNGTFDKFYFKHRTYFQLNIDQLKKR